MCGPRFLTTKEAIQVFQSCLFLISHFLTLLFESVFHTASTTAQVSSVTGSLFLVHCSGPSRGPVSTDLLLAELLGSAKHDWMIMS